MLFHLYVLGPVVSWGLFGELPGRLWQGAISARQELGAASLFELQLAGRHLSLGLTSRTHRWLSRDAVGRIVREARVSGGTASARLKSKFSSSSPSPEASWPLASMASAARVSAARAAARFLP